MTSRARPRSEATCGSGREAGGQTSEDAAPPWSATFFGFFATCDSRPSRLVLLLLRGRAEAGALAVATTSETTGCGGLTNSGMDGQVASVFWLPLESEPQKRNISMP